MNKNKTIIGIDPGINITGVSIIKIINKKKIKIIKIKEINLKKLNNYIIKLHIIYSKINKIILNYKPNNIIMESSFLGKNVKSMKRLIQCQTSIILAAIKNKKYIIEYSPKTIKLLITGNGNSNKKELKKKLELFFKKKLNYSKNYDSSDSLGVAMSYIFKKYKLK
ncbi:MAG: crossover junction endodeoxyribonuclease RuvC [Candidatus Shikimatogenerans bostrichidophilus]|nr:MAG: crossover junction endodeoxyribonuclease RuvC [Candidatus Shikimatogenerans bostrichidophilus]